MLLAWCAHISLPRFGVRPASPAPSPTPAAAHHRLPVRRRLRQRVPHPPRHDHVARRGGGGAAVVLLFWGDGAAEDEALPEAAAVGSKTRRTAHAALHQDRLAVCGAAPALE